MEQGLWVRSKWMDKTMQGRMESGRVVYEC